MHVEVLKHVNTAFELNIAMGHAKNEGSSMTFSLEMGKKQLLQWMISFIGMINGQKWRNRLFNIVDYEHALSAVEEISNWQLMMDGHIRSITAIGAAFKKGFTMNQPSGTW